MTEAEVLRVTDLAVSIHGDEGVARVLDHIHLRLSRGKVLGVVGESGCGKSTLIRAILGILPGGARIDRGTIHFEGRDLLAMDEASLNHEIRGGRIGFIPQDPYLALNPLFTVGTQLTEIMRQHAPRDGLRGKALQRKFRNRLEALLRRVQLADPGAALDRYPHQFSGGQRQRLLIAGALACAPGLVIADEPTTALDVTTQQQILDLLRELARELDVSMLFVSHDLGVVARLCDEISVIYAGQTVESGPTRRVLDDPAHPYTRALIACHPARSNGFAGIPGSVPSPLTPPPGCRFTPRCDAARDICARRQPQLRAMAAEPNRAVDCRLYDAAPAQQDAAASGLPA
ncbi:MAG TPA: ABC transporter ATP-binding protein [Candidatus Binataceae bacterium]|nr:ABC transporter ATP-binding protein [Candidatus Binataceae bacterium]